MAGTFAGVGIVAAVIAIVAIAVWISFATERAFRRELAARPSLSDEEFFREFYTGAGIASEIPRRLRPIYCDYFNIDVGKLRPQDRPPEINDLDTVDLVQAIEAEFGIEISDDDAEKIDGSFDSIVQYLYRRLN